MSVTLARGLGAAQAALGVVLLARPAQLAPEVPSWLVRVLGARGVVQGALTAATPQPVTLALGASADSAHALSMLPVAIASSRYRRPAAISGAVAAVMAVAGAALARDGASAPGRT